MKATNTELDILKAIKDILSTARDKADTSCSKIPVMNEAATHSIKLLESFIKTLRLKMEQTIRLTEDDYNTLKNKIRVLG